MISKCLGNGINYYARRYSPASRNMPYPTWRKQNKSVGEHEVVAPVLLHMLQSPYRGHSSRGTRETADKFIDVMLRQLGFVLLLSELLLRRCPCTG